MKAIKVIGIALSLSVSGCSSLDQVVKLDTAPTHDSQLKHPEWASPQPNSESANYLSTGAMQPISPEIGTLTRFLSQQGIGYEIVAGGYTMIKLNEKIHFNKGSSQLSQQSKMWLNSLANYLATRSYVEIVIDGHTDDTGSIAFNEGLSQKRASAIKTVLINNNVQPAKIYTRGNGEEMPLCNNTTRSGQACNRRAELTLILSDN